MRSRYKITEKDGVYFVTSTIIEWMPVFTSQPYFEIIVETLKFYRANKNLKLFAFVILENHFHSVVSGPDMTNIMRSLKRHTSREIVKLLQDHNNKWLLNQLSYYKKRHKIESTFQVWQEGFHPELIFNEEMLVQKIEYIHYNPVKRGYVDLPEHWRYSSAEGGVYAVIEIDPLPV